MTDKKSITVNFEVSTDVGNKKNTCYLLYNTWDDYGFKTTFNMYFVNNLGKEKNIGIISITSKGLEEGSVNFDTSNFDSLSSKYCSLGQGQGYYEELMGLLEEERNAILTGLRDCVYQQDVFEEFKNERSFDVALLRHVSLNHIKNLFPSILLGNAIPTPYSFSYKLNDNESPEIIVEVTPGSNPPSNIHVLVGRNGVGKTRILSGIADSLTNNVNSSGFSINGELTFKQPPLYHREAPDCFANLITVAFSAFDKFSPIKQKNTQVPCQYIGLKDSSGNSLRTSDSLESDFKQSVLKCLEGQRKNRWIEAINILNSDPVFSEFKLEEYNSIRNKNDKLNLTFSRLSSGHKIVLFTITKLVELVDDKTLVIFDEPESHLHPPLLASFIRAISDLLTKRNAVAIIATHSPVVLQEVPKLCVTKIDRSGDCLSFSIPSIETYGENIGTLTREIFKLELMESGFYKTISNHLKYKPDYTALLSDFNYSIGSEGRAIARSIISTNQE